MSQRVRLEGIKKPVTPKDDAPVHCEDHNVTVRWGDLDPIQQLAVASGIDIEGDCILLPKHGRQR